MAMGYNDFKFTPLGLQHMFNRASMRRGVALLDKDEHESAMAFAEMCMAVQLASRMGVAIATANPAPREWGEPEPEPSE